MNKYGVVTHGNYYMVVKVDGTPEYLPDDDKVAMSCVVMAKCIAQRDAVAIVKALEFYQEETGEQL